MMLSADKIPLSGQDSSQQQTRASIYETLTTLSDEIINNIKTLSEESRYKIDEDIKAMREASYRERSPEAEYVARLFKKYADIATRLKNNKSNSNNKDVIFGRVEVPSFVYEGSPDQIIGFEAAKRSNIFYYRCTCILFSFLCFVILSTVHFINYGEVKPHDEFLPNCAFNSQNIQGSFNLRPFRACIAAASCVFVFNILFNTYYLLPVDSSNHKYVPGLQTLVEFFHLKIGSDEITISNSRAIVSDGTTKVASFCKVFSKMIEVILDVTLTVFTLLVCLSSSIILERGRRFDMGDGSIIYYTIGTFYETFEKTSPLCVNQSPTSKIRGGLAMLYLCLFSLVMTVQVSLRSYIHESKTKTDTPNDARNISQTHTLLSNKELDDVVEVSL